MNLEKLPPFTEDRHLQVVIETPRESRNKYRYDAETGLFQLRKVLPLGMRFPFDFGFVPSTRAPDGDPLDVLVLMEEPAFPGCLVTCRLLGVIEARQTEGGKTERNDRLVAQALGSQDSGSPRELSQLPPERLREIEAFFVHYNQLEGKSFKVTRRAGSKRARQQIEATRRAD